MSGIFNDCINARPTKTLKCVCGHSACPATPCPNYVPCNVKHEPTGHAWITTTNKYYKRTQPGRYDKGIITFGRTYVMCVFQQDESIHWNLSVWVDGQPVVLGAECLKIGIAINAGSDIIKHLIASDINRKPRRETGNSKLETGLVCPVDESKCDLCFGVRRKPCADAGTEGQP